ncbi:MAG TPA: hypothetical protein VHP14_08675 [Anaerolineales bacterium]|nr:hypothetical protein [Anaerolineales bacterium]
MASTTIVILILTGLVLLRGVLRNVPRLGPSLEKFAKWLSGFDVVIGVIALVVGILQILSLEGILLILAGLILAVGALRTIPSIGHSLVRLGNALAQFKAILGLIILLVGVLDFVNMAFGSLR